MDNLGKNYPLRLDQPGEQKQLGNGYLLGN